MKLFKKIVIIFFILAGFFLIRTYQPILNIVYPDQCLFLIDGKLAIDYQKSIKDSILQNYQQYKDAQKVIQCVINQFPEIESIDAYICETDKICFSCSAAKPLFSLNDTFVVDEQNKVFAKNHYRTEIVKDLYNIRTKADYSLQELISFFLSISQAIQKDFNITWVSADNILLQKKGDTNELIFSKQVIPTESDLACFDGLQSKVPQVYKKKKRVYDFRFNNQIIVS